MSPENILRRESVEGKWMEEVSTSGIVEKRKHLKEVVDFRFLLAAPFLRAQMNVVMMPGAHHNGFWK